MLRWILNRFDLYSEERYIRESRVRKSVYFPDQVGLHKANLGEHGPRPHAIILVHGFASKHWIWDDLIVAPNRIRHRRISISTLSSTTLFGNRLSISMMPR
jgi:hypothetical protein